MPSPSISVLLPAYNAERYLAEAVESILAQTFTDFELIVIDDGSTDRTPRMIQELAKRDPRVRPVSRPNRGLTRTLNEALALATGEFVARMDADDISMSERFELQLAHLRAHPELVAVGSRVLLVDPDGDPIREIGESLEHERIDESYLRGGSGTLVHAAAMFRRAALLDIGGYRSEFECAEDVDLFLRLAECGRLANLPQVLYRYRMHHTSVGHDAGVNRQNRAAREAVRAAMIRRGLLAPAAQNASEAASLEEPGPGPLRTKAERETSHHLRWAWWALQSGHLKTARKHAFASLWRAPLSPDSWRVTFCVLRGR